MREIYIKSKAGLLPIGRRGENLATRVHLPEVPESGQAVTVYVLRNGDTAAYPASEIEITDTEIIWTVTSVDTGKSGRGKVQYKFADATTGEIIKTEIYHFVVGLAIDTEVGPTPDPYETWLDSLTELAGQAQIAAREAESEATRAAESAEQAETSAQNAEQSATSAGTYATNAQASATAASQKAAQAAASEANAQTYAEQAQASAGSAGASATAAESSATSAAESAEDASESKTAAETARQQAYESAQDSQTYSGQSQTYASQAAASATAAGQSATAASASATSASQSAGTATTKASEASASATTATNKASEASASATAAQEARTGAETAQAGAESAAQTAQAGADAVGLLREQIYNSYPNVEAEPGPIVSITDGADGIPVKSLIVGIEPVQAGSGDPSPDNVRPITGWTGATVQRCGKNLFDKSAITPNSWIAVNTTTIEPAPGYFVSDYIPVEVGKPIFCTKKGASRSIYYDKWKNPIAYFSWSVGSLNPAYDGYIRVTGVNASLDTLQLELGSTATSYEPYQGSTYPIAFPTEAGTVYGGSLDVTNGVLTVDRAVKVYNGASAEGWVKSNYGYFGTSRKITDAIDRNANSEDFRSNKYAWGNIANATQTLGGCLIWGTVRVRLADMSISLDDWNSQLSAEPLQVVYRLATPQTYQLTPTEVTTLLGSNSVWADTGDVQEMAYRADTKLYIDGVYEDYQDDLADYASALAALG